ncbi:MAG: hypothetical protein QXJ59_11160 [Thermofilaceae archaeon]
MAEQIQVFRTTLTPTVRGAISKVRRWFYASLYSKVKGDAREQSKNNWVKLARMLIDKTNEQGVSDKAGRVVLYYYIRDGVFVPVKAEIEYFEIKPLGKFEVTFSDS